MSVIMVSIFTISSCTPLNFSSDFHLLIDTGSSDLWVSNHPKLKLNSTTNATVNLTYGIGCAYGSIAYAPVTFGGYRVDNQAFLSVSKACSDNADAEGILGLGLNGLSALERKTKNTSSRSVMANMFAQHPSTPHLIGLALERSDDGEQTAGGFLTIGEYDPQFSNITYTPKNPVTPTSGSRWTIAMDAMTINGKHYDLTSSVQGMKKGQAVALIDSGTSLAYIPSDAVDAIYSQLNGSVHVKTADQDAWFVPCLEQVNLSFTFAYVHLFVLSVYFGPRSSFDGVRNTPYPINPMELTTPMRAIHKNDQYTVCINAFRTTLKGTEHELDFLLGDIFMRNVYSMYVVSLLLHRSSLTAPHLTGSTLETSRRRTGRRTPMPTAKAPRSSSSRAPIEIKSMPVSKRTAKSLSGGIRRCSI